MAALLAGLLLALLAAPTASCPVGRAQYAMMGHPEFTAGFLPVPPHPEWRSDVALYIRSARTGRTFWFLFDQGNGSVSAISTTDVRRAGWRPPHADGGERPFGSLDFLAADAGLIFGEWLPRRGAPAPAYVLMPQLNEALRRRGPEPREGAPTAFFKLAGCARR